MDVIKLGHSDFLWYGDGHYDLLVAEGEGQVMRVCRLDTGGRLRAADRRGDTAVLAYVTQDSPKKVTVHNLSQKVVIKVLTFTSEVLGVKMNEARLVACTQDEVHVFRLDTLASVKVIADLPPRASGLMALSGGGHEVMGTLALPVSTENGELQLLSLSGMTFATPGGVRVHQDPLVALAFSPCGSMLASADRRGQVFVLSSVPELRPLQQFHRSTATPATVCCLDFSACGSLLLAASDRPTVHVFQVTGGRERQGQGQGQGEGEEGGAEAAALLRAEDDRADARRHVRNVHGWDAVLTTVKFNPEACREGAPQQQQVALGGLGGLLTGAVSKAWTSMSGALHAASGSVCDYLGLVGERAKVKAMLPANYPPVKVVLSLPAEGATLLLVLTPGSDVVCFRVSPDTEGDLPPSSTHTLLSIRPSTKEGDDTGCVLC